MRLAIGFVLLAGAWAVSAQSITEAEYFFDNAALAEGSGIPITVSGSEFQASTLLESVDLTALAPGSHVLYFRTRDNLGAWSSAIAQPFLVAGGTTDTMSVSRVTAVEIFFDADPGEGGGQAVSSSSEPALLSVGSLVPDGTPGAHVFSFRAQQDGADWSAPVGQPYFAAAGTADTQVIPFVDRIETFVDVDPGLGLGNDTALVDVDLARSATFTRDSFDIFSVSLGSHTLFWRARDSQGNYSAEQAQGFDTRDLDGDRVADLVDAFPNDPREWGDADGDGIGNNSDPDIDGDGLDNAVDTDDDGDSLPDDYEIANGLDPADPTDAIRDDDDDGLTNTEEFVLGTDPQNPDTDGDTVVDSLDPSPLRVGTITEVPTPSGLSTSDRFGEAVAISGNMMAVGAPEAGGTGAVYLYNLEGGEPVLDSTLELPQNVVLSDFGSAVAMNDSMLAVGAPGFITESEAQAGNPLRVAIYERLGRDWQFKEALTGTGSDLNDDFGSSVALDGTMLAVGAPEDDEGESNGSGAVYVFEFDGDSFKQMDKAKPLDPQPNQRFGASVAVENGRVAVGAPNSPINQATQGLAQMYELLQGNLSSIGTVTGSQSTTGSRFGQSVQLVGGNLLVGAPGDVSDQGSVYQYDPSASFVESRRLSDPEGGAGHEFGASVFAAEDLVAVGAPGAGSGGAVFLYQFAEGLSAKGTPQPDRIDALSGQAGFGAAVAVFEDRVLVGAPSSSDGGSAALERDPRKLFSDGFE